jgi:hypothetical protein
LLLLESSSQVSHCYKVYIYYLFFVLMNYTSAKD